MSDETSDGGALSDERSEAISNRPFRQYVVKFVVTVCEETSGAFQLGSMLARIQDSDAMAVGANDNEAIRNLFLFAFQGAYPTGAHKRALIRMLPDDEEP